MTRTELPERGGVLSRSLVLYAVIGLSGVTLDYLLFLVLFNSVGLHEQLANAVSTTVGIINNFTLNTLLNFRKRDRLLLRFARFYSVGLAGIVLTFVLLQVFSGALGVDPNIVKAVSLPIVLVCQYTLNRRWSFG
ncbi:GtrA family protein [Parasphingorhabdus pacifica]